MSLPELGARKEDTAWVASRGLDLAVAYHNYKLAKARGVQGEEARQTFWAQVECLYRDILVRGLGADPDTVEFIKIDAQEGRPT